MKLSHLPPEIIYEISNYLPTWYILNLRMTCQALNESFDYLDDRLQEKYLYNVEHIDDRRLFKKKITVNLPKGCRRIAEREPAWNNNFLIRAAAAEGDVELVKMLLKYTMKSVYTGPTVDIKSLPQAVIPWTNDEEALTLAVKNNHLEIVRLLMGCKGVDPSIRENKLLGSAVYQNNLEMVKLLLEDVTVRETEKFYRHSLGTAKRLGYYRIEAEIVFECTNIGDYYY